MAIDWAGEPFARLFKRETDDDLLLSWEARAVWHAFLWRCDRNGVLETKRGVRGFAAQIRIPVDVVERVLQELLEDGRLQSVQQLGFRAPNYKVANYTPRSGAARMADVRVRDTGATPRDTSPHGAGGSETNGHGSEPDTGPEPPIDCVTPRHRTSPDVTESDAAFPSQIRSGQIRSDHTGARARARSGKSSRISADWTPQEPERILGAELGLDVDAEAREFLAFWLGDGKAKVDWDRTFASRLHFQAKRRKTRPIAEPRNVPEL